VTQDERDQRLIAALDELERQNPGDPDNAWLAVWLAIPRIENVK
jgi:hypothetical protein